MDILSTAGLCYIPTDGFNFVTVITAYTELSFKMQNRMNAVSFRLVSVRLDSK